METTPAELVTGNSQVGGLVRMESEYADAVSESYSVATCLGNSSVGGLIGYQSGTVTEASYFAVLRTVMVLSEAAEAWAGRTQRILFYRNRRRHGDRAHGHVFYSYYTSGTGAAELMCLGTFRFVRAYASRLCFHGTFLRRCGIRTRMHCRRCIGRTPSRNTELYMEGGTSGVRPTGLLPTNWVAGSRLIPMLPSTNSTELRPYSTALAT